MEKEEIGKRVESLMKRFYQIQPNTPLPEEFIVLGQDGAVDSVAALQLVVALEEEFGIVVEDEDIAPENFRNLEVLSRYIGTKLARG